VRTFGERSAGELIAFWGSGDELCVAVVNGSAAARLAIRAGATVEIELPASLKLAGSWLAHPAQLPDFQGGPFPLRLHRLRLFRFDLIQNRFDRFTT